MPAALPPDEAGRLVALRSCDILDTPPEPAFDDVAALAARAFDVPIALVSLVDEVRQWFKARTGLAATETPRDWAFCAHALLNPGGVFEVPDTRLDERFARNPLVTGEPHIRFYAGAPIVLDSGEPLGTVCVIDRRPRQLEPGQRAMLQALARTTARLIGARRTERQLAASERRFRGVFDQTRIGLALAGLDGRLQLVNRRYCEIVRRGREQLLGSPAMEALVPASDLPQQARQWDALVASGVPVSVEAEVPLDDKERLWLFSYLSLVRSELGEPWAVIVAVQDVSGNRALANAKDAAEAVARAKTAFLATMSHEIRTPLNAVIGFSELLAGAARTDEEREYAHLVRSSGHHLLNLINDILDLSKLDAGGLQLESRPFTVPAVVGEAVDLLTLAAREKNLPLSVSIDAQVPPAVVGDPGRVRQVLINYLSNAIKFTPAGEVKLRVAAVEHAAGCELRFEVQDTGVGVPADRQAALFNPFTQADASVQRRYGGTGLGLAISRRLAEAMGGTVWLNSAPGAGSTFGFSVVAGVAAQVPVAAAAGTGRMPPDLAQRNPLRILVVDDSAPNLKLSAALLRLLGYTADLAHNGEQAVQAVADRPYDLVLMDVQMPGMDGCEAARAIRGGGARQPRIVALTAGVMTEEKEACLAAGMDAVLEKPIVRAQLIAELERSRRIA